MEYAQTKVSGAGLEKWLEQHIAARSRMEFISACITLMLAFAASVLALVILFSWIVGGPPFANFELAWLVPAAFVLVFLTYPLVTPKRLPFIGWLRESHESDPLKEFAASPFAVRYYFWEGYLGLSAIYWAPLFFHMAIEEFRKSMAIRMLDRSSVLCAMRMLAERGSRVPWYEFEAAFPILPIQALQRNLSLVEGVVFLNNEPGGATLTDSLRAEIGAAMA